MITPQFGTRMAKKDSVVRMSSLIQSAPALQITDINQVAALPLESRIKLNPWDDHVKLQKSKPVAPPSIRDKMAFEVTPMVPHLARYRSNTSDMSDFFDFQNPPWTTPPSDPPSDARGSCYDGVP